MARANDFRFHKIHHIRSKTIPLHCDFFTLGRGVDQWGYFICAEREGGWSTLLCDEGVGGGGEACEFI